VHRVRTSGSSNSPGRTNVMSASHPRAPMKACAVQLVPNGSKPRAASALTVAGSLDSSAPACLGRCAPGAGRDAALDLQMVSWGGRWDGDTWQQAVAEAPYVRCSRVSQNPFCLLA